MPPAGSVAGPDAEAETEDADEEGDSVVEEAESRDAGPQTGPDVHRYTAELSDAELERRWKAAPEALGCVSVGFADEGRLINAQKFPPGDGWTVVSPGLAWATPETIAYVTSAIRQVRSLHPEAPALRVNQISACEGGYLRPHKSHQNGRDVDLAFYYPGSEPLRVKEREKHINVGLNWELIKALVTLTDVQLILVDRRVQKVLYDYALAHGEDKAWLDSLFHAERHSLIQHARRHRDHFHVRFYSPRAQELGRRLAPLLAQRPEQNIFMHRVRQGDTLGAIARKYGSSTASLQKANHLKGTFLRLAQVLRVPLKGPCTRCPVPPAVILPPRRLPPGFKEVAQLPGDQPVAHAAAAVPVPPASPVVETEATAP